MPKFGNTVQIPLEINLSGETLFLVYDGNSFHASVPAVAKLLGVDSEALTAFVSGLIADDTSLVKQDQLSTVLAALGATDGDFNARITLLEAANFSANISSNSQRIDAIEQKDQEFDLSFTDVFAQLSALNNAPPSQPLVETIHTQNSGIIDFSNGGWQRIELAADAEISAAAGFPVGGSVRFTLVPNGHMVTWGAEITKFKGGSPPATIGAESVFLIEKPSENNYTIFYLGDIS